MKNAKNDIIFKKYLWIYLFFLLFYLNVIFTSASASVTVSVQGIGDSQDMARKAALRSAVGQVTGMYLKSERQLKNSVLIKDKIIEKTSGFIKSYKVESCFKKTSGFYHCNLKVNVETDKKKIIKFLKKLLGKNTCAVNITENIEDYENKDRILEPLIVQKLIENGYYVVTNDFDPAYNINGTVKIKKAMSQLETKSFKVAKLNVLKIESRDQVSILGVVTSSDAKKCIGTGNTISDAGIDLLKCLSDDLIKNIMKKLVKPNEFIIKSQ